MLVCLLGREIKAEELHKSTQKMMVDAFRFVTPDSDHFAGVFWVLLVCETSAKGPPLFFLGESQWVKLINVQHPPNLC